MYRFAFVCLLSFYLPCTAVGQTLDYTSENRFVQDITTISGDLFGNPGTVSTDTIFANSFAPFFVGPFGLATQMSSLNAQSIVASGTALSITGPPVVPTTSLDSVSNFETTFVLSEPAAFSLDLSVLGVAFSEVRLVGPSLNVEESIAPIVFFDPSEFILSDAGVLEPGEYNFLVNIESAASDTGPATFSLDFNVSAVPEPNSAAFLLLTMCGCLTRRNRIA